MFVSGTVVNFVILLAPLNTRGSFCVAGNNAPPKIGERSPGEATGCPSLPCGLDMVTEAV